MCNNYAYDVVDAILSYLCINYKHAEQDTKFSDHVAYVLNKSKSISQEVFISDENDEWKISLVFSPIKSMLCSFLISFTLTLKVDWSELI